MYIDTLHNFRIPDVNNIGQYLWLQYMSALCIIVIENHFADMYWRR